MIITDKEIMILASPRRFPNGAESQKKLPAFCVQLLFLSGAVGGT